ncbi:MAG: HYR domain-containing protein, partial [Saprospiraceae bacterium]
TDNAPIPNKKTCSFTVKVNDTQKPTIACPPNKTASTDAGVCSASVTYVTPTATDNCNSPAPTVAHVSGGSAPTPSGLNSISTFDKGVTTVKWKATDAAGNTKECTFKVAVNDLEKPTMNCLSDISANNDAGLCSAVVTYTLPTFTDNCPPTSGQSVKISGPASGSGFPTGMTNVVYRATDASGNTKQCTMKVTVTDTESPSITCPGPVVVTGSGTPCTAAAIYATPTASDNCSGSLTPFLLSGLASGSSYPAGVTTNTWRAIAGNGQTTDCSFTVTVECPGGMMNGGVMNDELRGMSQHFHVSETWNVSEPALSMRLVPNPATTQVEIWIGGTGSERLGIEAAGETAGRDLSVFDAQGRMVWQRTVEIGEEMVLFDFATKNLADGLYFVMLRADGAAVLTKRLIVCNAD